MDEVIKLIEQLIELGTGRKWVPLAAVLIGLAVRLVKSDPIVAWFPVTIDPKYRAMIAVLLGIASGVLERIVGGTNWVTAIVGGLLSALAAITSHEVVVEGLRGGREFGQAKAGGGPMFPGAVLMLALPMALLPACALTREVKTVVRDVSAEIVNDADQATVILDALHSVANVYFLASPDAAKQAQVEQYFADARLALAMAIDAAKGANTATEADYNAAFGHFREAYSKLTTLLNDLGIVGKASGAKMSVNRRGGGTSEIPVPRAAALKGAQ